MREGERESGKNKERETWSCPHKIMKAYAITMARGPQKSGCATIERSMLYGKTTYLIFTRMSMEARRDQEERKERKRSEWEEKRRGEETLEVDIELFAAERVISQRRIIKKYIVSECRLM